LPRANDVFCALADVMVAGLHRAGRRFCDLYCVVPVTCDGV
jgi:hypothetical protein